jgi:hypothetical protein
MLQTTAFKCFSKTIKNKSFQQCFSEKNIPQTSLNTNFHLVQSTQTRWMSYGGWSNQIIDALQTNKTIAPRYNVDKQKIGSIYNEATRGSNLGLPEDFLANVERPFDPEDEVLEKKKACLFCVDPNTSMDAMVFGLRFVLFTNFVI